MPIAPFATLRSRLGAKGAGRAMTVVWCLTAIGAGACAAGEDLSGGGALADVTVDRSQGEGATSSGGIPATGGGPAATGGSGGTATAGSGGTITGGAGGATAGTGGVAERTRRFRS